MELRPKVVAVAVVTAVVAVVAGATAVAVSRIERESISVHEIRVDRNGRAFVDVVFNRPVPAAPVGEVVTDPPASIAPAIHGIWTWGTHNILRFQPAGGFPIASEYKLTIAPDEIATAELPFSGEREFVIRTDDFLVRSVTWRELPAASGFVVLQGEVAFNYRVAPESLAPRIRMRDGTRIELITSYPADAMTWRSAPLRKEKEQREVALVIAKDLFPLEGNVTLGKDYVQNMTIGSSDVLLVRNVTAKPDERDTVLRIELSSAVSVDALQDRIGIKPAVKYRTETEGNDVLLIGGFRPGGSYELAIEEGLVALDTALLREPFRTTVTVPDLEPLLAFQSEGMFLSASGRRNVAIDTINVRAGTLAIDRVYRNNLFFYLQSSGYAHGDSDQPYYRAYYHSGRVDHQYGDRIVEKALRFPDKPNARSTSTIPIGSLVRTSSPGLYKVSVFRDQEEWRHTTRWLLITDLGIVTKRSKSEVLIWVASFKDLAPIANAAVTLVDDQNQTIARGRTDEAGFWTARNISEKAHPFVVTVERGNDFSFLVLGDSRVDTSAFDIGGAAEPASGYSAFLYGERTLYRPGETLRGVASVRTTALRFPPRMPLVLKHTDPAGEPRGSIRLNADASGMASYDIALPPYTRTGRHTLALFAGDTEIGSTSFHVEEFVPDRLKVEIEPGATGSQPVVQFDVSSSYLFGAPASSLAVETKVQLVPSTFTARAFEEFTFYAPSRKFDPREVASDSSTLDDKGRKQYTIAVPEKLAVPSSLAAVITARVQEQGGRGVSAITRMPVHPYPYYIGIRELPPPPHPTLSPSSGRRRGEGVSFEWATVSPAGKEVPSAPLRADIYEERWQTVMRQTGNGGYRYESTLDTEHVRTIPIANGKSRGVVSFRTGEWGSYRIVITDPVSLAATELTFDSWSGAGYSPWAMKNPGRLELTIDKPAYRSGESVAVTIKSPFPGKALMTVESDRVLHTKLVTLSSNTARVDIPLTVAARPNAYITATVVRTADDLEPGEAGRAYGAIRVEVDRAENELRPEIRVVEEMRSSRKLNVSVKTAPHASVTIAAVDQGILQLVGEERPDPFAFFYQHRALAVMTHDIFALLLPEVAAKNNAIAGGSESGAGISQFLRTDGMRRTKPVSFWSGLLTAGDDGIAKATFDIPDFQGAVRVTAVVHGEQQYGSSDKLVLVRDPVVVLATVPRFVSTNDAFSIPVTVRNDTKKNGTFDVTVKLTGDASLTSNVTQRVAIDRNRETTVLFALHAAKNRGGIELAFTASGNGERGTASATIPVYPSLPDATDELSGSIASKTMTLPAPPPARFVEGSARRDVIISALPLIQLRGRLDYLVHYPYGCVEQTTSTAFPMIYIGDLAQELDPRAFRNRNPAAYVSDGIRRLGTMQTAMGGFAMWPYGTEINIWASIYATHFLTEAKRAGYAVDAMRHGRALDYVAQLAKARPEYDTGGLQQAVYALYVLARAQRPDLGTMDYVREKHAAQLMVDSRALLGAAYAAVGNPAAVSAMLADVDREENVLRETGSNYNSTLRNRALVVLALLDAAPKDPRLPALAERLSRELIVDHWYTPQDSAMGLLALGQYFRMRNANATYRGALLHDGKVVGRFDGKTKRFDDLPSTGELSVTFENGYVADAAYYTVRVRGTPLESSFQPSAEGMRITRTFMDRNGTPLQTNDVKQGEIVVIRTEVTSMSGRLENVVIQNLLPAGLEVENPRLTTTETLPWVQHLADVQHSDIRDDRVLFFVDLNRSVTFYTVARAITPGEFRLPPAQAEAMYAPRFRATEGLGTFKVRR
ncbi:MAG TPA: MG2 domain-containing protein [Thermoanaerobaculia bacterium]|nr:MG2 domain-containing protein [Thermoanaerobaculia bacterium]